MKAEIDPHELLDAALRDDPERLHELAGQLGVSMRDTLYAAGSRMLNALAAAGAPARLRETALTDEDMDHDDPSDGRPWPVVPYDRVRGMWPR